MILFDSTWYLPDGETHLQSWMIQKNHRVAGRLTYQKHKYDAALAYCPQHRVAIDIGAHVGLWSFWMARDFHLLHAFEPKPEHVQCWQRNMDGQANAYIYDVALGASPREVGLRTGPASSGDTGVEFSGKGVAMVTLDSYRFTDVDLIKIDCEGFEAFVIDGARDTIARCKPTVIVEQKPGHGQRFGLGELDAVRLLEELGAHRVWDYAGDYVLTFQDAA